MRGQLFFNSSKVYIIWFERDGYVQKFLCTSYLFIFVNIKKKVQNRRFVNIFVEEFFSNSFKS